MGTRWRVGLAVGAVAALAGCGAPPTPRAAPRLTTFSAGGLSFRYPAPWHAEPWGDNPPGTFETPVVYLSTAQLHPPCVTSRSETSCGVPVATLAPGGLLVTWAYVGRPTRSPIVSAPNTTIAGRPAQVSASSSASGAAPACTGLHSARSVTAQIQLAPPDNELIMVACLRGPGPGGQLSEVTAMLRSLTMAEG